MALVLGVVLGACGGDDGIDSTMTKAEALALNAADWGYDVCELYGWYGDEECDEFCPLPDPDCQEPPLGLRQPVCRGIGSRSEGWYWGDTDELIKYELCGSMSDPECGAIGSRSEGWYSSGDLIVWDVCHRTARIALLGEACGGSIGYGCYDGLYCQGLPEEGVIGGSGVCLLMGTCETTPDCSVGDNDWYRLMCVGYASCEAGQCAWHCDQENNHGGGTNNQKVDIPDADPAGITSTIDVQGLSACDQDSVSVSVDVRIRHTYVGDLVVGLTDPSGNRVVLWNREGGSQQDLVLSDVLPTGRLAQHGCNGIWTLDVSDLASMDTGTLETWTLNLECR
jgi:subtilisin-like proprotein convertase family protein